MSLADPLAKARAALLDHLPKDAILARYQAAGGQELISGKFANSESSAALATNAFGLFGERPELLSRPDACLGGHEAQRVELEAQMRFPWSGGLHPWLDVGVQTSERLIGMPPHRAGPDAWVTAHLLADLAQYATFEQMVAWTREPRPMPKLTFGKHRGQAWAEVPTDYLQWMQRQTDMDADTVWHAQQELGNRNA